MKMHVFRGRLRCNFIFQYLVLLAEEEHAIDANSAYTLKYNGITLGDMSQCQDGKGLRITHIVNKSHCEGQAIA